MRIFLNKLFDVFCGILIIAVLFSSVVFTLIGLDAKEAKRNHELYESYIRVTGNPKNIQEVDFIRLKDANLIKIE
jgi:hypothetical protein